MTFNSQTETKELTWRNETSRLVEQERSKALSYAEQQWEVTRHGERLVWQQRVDALLQKVAILVTEKEKTDKNILQEVETRIQVISINLIRVHSMKDVPNIPLTWIRIISIKKFFNFHNLLYI